MQNDYKHSGLTQWIIGATRIEVELAVVQTGDFDAAETLERVEQELFLPAYHRVKKSYAERTTHPSLRLRAVLPRTVPAQEK